MVDYLPAVAERQLEWQVSSRIEPEYKQLEKNQIHLWLVDLARLLDESDNANCLALLTKPEIQRSDRIVSQAHRRLYLGGRIGLRMLLTGYSGFENSALAFTYGDRGKPNLKNKLPGGTLNFNYTLSRGIALYAFSLNRELGVDVEMFPRKINMVNLAKRTLSDSERSCWNNIPEARKNDAMLACWTRKEAYGKTLGVGIRYAMNQVTLFSELHKDCWRTAISGLFDSEAAGDVRQVCGIQLGLPIPGAASLMYAQMESGIMKTDEEDGFIAVPQLQAFQLLV
jgi:4'-phosphopantetheinyl transferase